LTRPRGSTTSAPSRPTVQRSINDRRPKRPVGRSRRRS
jgi:hypothetical protein